MKISNLGLAFALSLFFIVLLLSSSASVDAEEVNIGVRGEDVTISAILLQNGTYGTPVPNQTIEFYDQTMNSFLNYGLTNAAGIATIVWNIPIDHSLGPTTLNATYRGNESLFLAPSCQSIIIDILSSINLTINYDEDILAPEDLFSFEILTLDDTESPVQNAVIFVYSNDILLATSLTNDSGVASFSIHCNNSWSNLGYNTIFVHFEQDLENYLSGVDESFIIQVRKIETQINMDPCDNQVLLGSTFNANISFTSTDEEISADLAVFLDELFLKNVHTDNQGNYILSLDIDESFSLGPHTLQIRYLGNDRYNESMVTTQFTVFSFLVMDFKTDTPMVVNSVVDLHIRINDALNRSVDGKIHLSDLSSGFNVSFQLPRSSSYLEIPFSIMNPTGLHNLSIEIENPFMLNSSTFCSFIVWSLPTITLLKTNIFHYASPNQEVVFLVHLTDFSGNISDRDIHLLLDNQTIESLTTDENAIVSFMTHVSSHEGVYNYSIFCPMNLDQYELPIKLDYQIIVTRQIPVILDLNDYEVIPPLRIIRVKLQVVCLNGSFLQGVCVKFGWLSVEKYKIAKENGEVILQIPLPSTSGNFTLNYEIEPTDNLAYSVGAVSFSIAYTSILSAQGIGMNGFIVSLTISFFLFAIPIIRQRFLL